MSTSALSQSKKHLPFLGKRTLIMGILNLTPDSFYDGGRYQAIGKAIERAREMEEEGADIIDIGAESSRPGAHPLPLEEEARRLFPVLKEVVREVHCPISIDTYKADIAQRAMEIGASMINDISALRADPRMARVIKEYRCPVVLMHMKGTPLTMQKQPHYHSVVLEVLSFLKGRVNMALKEGISEEQIIIDPGLGFGKTFQHNIEILRRLRLFTSLGRPLLIGPSRKAFIGHLLGSSEDERLEGTAAVVALSIHHGADIIRIHDVKEMVKVARVADALKPTKDVPATYISNT